jgi:hypothetical protein
VSLIKGQLTISRPSNGRGEEWITIEFRDEDAGVRFAQFRVSTADFARAITGLGYIPGEIEVGGLHLVGTKAENKTEFIECEPPYGDKAKKATLLKKIEALEVDGWKSRSGDWDNHHNYTRKGVSIVFFRNVPKEKP